jgi:GNAT superfamily N-acetyltransferase
MRSQPVIAVATPAHFASIASIERAAPSGSLVALNGLAILDEALARGHHVVVALEAGEVVGWSWFSLEAGRGGDDVGRLHRIAVRAERRRQGIGRALLGHVHAALAARSCTRLRATFGDDDAARAFFGSAGFAVETVTMEQPL